MRIQQRQMLLALLVFTAVSPSLGTVTDDKCKCLMCVCDVDPHPLPPALPSRHHPPPPSEPEPTPVYHSPPQPTPPEYYPPPSEPEPTPVYYLPPPAQPYGHPWGQANWPPAPVLGIVGTPGQMYPPDTAYQYHPSSAHRLRRPGFTSLLVAVAAHALVAAAIAHGHGYNAVAW